MAQDVINDYQHLIHQNEAQSIYSASVAFHKLFGAGSTRMDSDTEKQRKPLLAAMHSHEQLLLPANALTIWKEGDSFDYRWDHKDLITPKLMCKGYVATSGSDNPGIHIFRMDDQTSRLMWDKRKSTQSFFNLLVNIFLRDGIINQQFRHINRSGDRIMDKAIIMTDFAYNPEAVCILENGSYAPNPIYNFNRPLTEKNLPWIPTFQALDLIL